MKEERNIINFTHRLLLLYYNGMSILYVYLILMKEEKKRIFSFLYNRFTHTHTSTFAQGSENNSK